MIKYDIYRLNFVIVIVFAYENKIAKPIFRQSYLTEIVLENSLRPLEYILLLRLRLASFVFDHAFEEKGRNRWQWMCWNWCALGAEKHSA